MPILPTKADAAMSVFARNNVPATKDIIAAAPYMYEALRQVVFKRLGRTPSGDDIALTMAEIALDMANGVKLNDKGEIV